VLNKCLQQPWLQKSNNFSRQEVIQGASDRQQAKLCKIVGTWNARTMLQIGKLENVKLKWTD